MISIKNCYKDEFEKVIMNKYFVCFGAGKELEKICGEHPSIINRIVCVADNNLSGTVKKIQDVDISIVSIKDVPKSDNYIYLITTIKYADEIVKQLDEIEKLDSIDIYIPFFFKMREKYFEIYKTEFSWHIPKVIHYCWFGNAEMPDNYKQNIESWKKYCPDYEIVRWDESNYDYKKIEYMYDAYKHKKWGFVPDYARLDIINSYGGIYLDTDVEIIKSYDELLGYKLFCGFETDDYIAFGLGFGGVADNEILKKMMHQYEQTKFVNSDGTLNQTASPVYQTEILKSIGINCNGSFQVIDGCAVFPAEFFAPIDPLGMGEPTERTFSIHQYAGTWLDEDVQNVKNRMKESIDYIKRRICNI